MAWELGPFSVRQGTSIRIAFWWDNDPGVQALQVYPVGDPDSIVGTTSAVEITHVRVENEPGRGRIRPHNTQLTYFVTVATPRPLNNSSIFIADPVVFMLRGGQV